MTLAFGGTLNPKSTFYGLLDETKSRSRLLMTSAIKWEAKDETNLEWQKARWNLS